MKPSGGTKKVHVTHNKTKEKFVFPMQKKGQSLSNLCIHVYGKKTKNAAEVIEHRNLSKTP